MKMSSSASLKTFLKAGSFSDRFLCWANVTSFAFRISIPGLSRFLAPQVVGFASKSPVDLGRRDLVRFLDDPVRDDDVLGVPEEVEGAILVAAESDSELPNAIPQKVRVGAPKIRPLIF